MRNLHLKLTIAILVVFGLLILGYVLYEPVWYRIHASRLASDDPDARWEAFQFLCRQGKRGRKVISDYCYKHSDNVWGEVNDGLQMRISTRSSLFVGKPGQDYKSHDLGFSVTVRNIGKEVRQTVFPSRGPVHINIEEALVQPNRSDLHFSPGLMGGIYGPIKVRPGCKHTEEISDDTLFHIIAFDEFMPGIYTISATSAWHWPDKFPMLESNLISFAILPRTDK